MINKKTSAVFNGIDNIVYLVGRYSRTAITSSGKWIVFDKTRANIF